MHSYKNAVREAELLLEENGKSMQLAKMFMMEITEQRNINLYMAYEDEMDEELYRIYTEGIERINHDEPMQYILGYEWFYGRPFNVNRDVLIPRPETEELVSNVLIYVDEMRKKKEHLNLIDVGCGSGAIGITLKLEEPSLNVFASDISKEALVVAEENAKKLEADMEFLQGSMLEPYIEKGIKVDVLVCNPPYIRNDAAMEASVVDFEPNVALFGGIDGLYFYRLVFDDCKKILNEESVMAFEIGYDQKDELLSEVEKRFPEAKTEVLKDMYGKDRMLIVDFRK